MKPTARLLVASVFVVLAACTLLFINRSSADQRDSESAIPAPEADQVGKQSSQNGSLESDERELPVKPTPPTPIAADPPKVEANNQVAPPPQRTLAPVGAESDWLVEFEGKTQAELVAAEKVLRDELQQDLAAEAERRFSIGQYIVYALGEEPPVINYGRGAIFQRNDEQSVRIVELDRSRDFEIFARERKADWLRERIRRP